MRGCLVLKHISQRHSKVAFYRGIVLVLGLHADRVGRRISLVIESRCGLEGAIGLEGEEGIVSIPCPAYELVGQSSVGTWISGFELAHDGAHGLVLGDPDWSRYIGIL